MVDDLTSVQRSRCMAAIRSKNTKPELFVRRIAHHLGFRFRLHCRNLPGKPDIVFPRHKKIIFVHGCFWHKHRCRFGCVKPATNFSYWERKRASNVQRDKIAHYKLRRLGWRVFVIWECQTQSKRSEWLEHQINSFLCADL
ncbi:MAG: very short patch repair endonuclease [Candidatus Sumerlaeota bacterium]|nr:very short patch repair endonuclease [Candidatus Sumerlaeota bacterium]